MLKKFVLPKDDLMPKEVKPLETHEVAEISPFAKKDLTPEEQELRLKLITGVEGMLGQRTESEHRIANLAESIRELRWEEMEDIAGFLAKKLSRGDVQVDPHLIAWAMNEWKRFVLEPPAVVED